MNTDELILHQYHTKFVAANPSAKPCVHVEPGMMKPGWRERSRFFYLFAPHAMAKKILMDIRIGRTSPDDKVEPTIGQVYQAFLAAFIASPGELAYQVSPSAWSRGVG